MFLSQMKDDESKKTCGKMIYTKNNISKLEQTLQVDSGDLPCGAPCDSCVSGALATSNLMPSKRWLAMATSVCRPLPRPPSNSAWLRLKAPTLRRPSKQSRTVFEHQKLTRNVYITSVTSKLIKFHVDRVRWTQVGCKESNEQRNNWNNHKLNRVWQEQKQQTWLASKRS